MTALGDRRRGGALDLQHRRGCRSTEHDRSIRSTCGRLVLRVVTVRLAGLAAQLQPHPLRFRSVRRRRHGDLGSHQAGAIRMCARPHAVAARIALSSPAARGLRVFCRTGRRSRCIFPATSEGSVRSPDIPALTRRSVIDRHSHTFSLFPSKSAEPTTFLSS